MYYTQWTLQIKDTIEITSYKDTSFGFKCSLSQSTNAFLTSKERTTSLLNDEMAGSNVSFIWRFHCMHMATCTCIVQPYMGIQMWSS